MNGRRLHLVIPIALVILAGLVPRFFRISNPLLVFHAWRQCETAAIARNIFRNNFDVFHPMIDTNGPGPSLVETEFQFFSLVVALLYKVFGIHEILGRLVSLFFFLATIPLICYLARRIGGDTAMIWATGFFCFSPLATIMSRAFQPDSTMLFFSTSSLAAFWYYLENVNDRRYSIVPGLLLGLALLTKLVCLYIGLPFLALVLVYRGRKGLWDPDVWITAVTALVPAAAWYWYASGFPLSFNIWGLGPQHLDNWLGWMSYQYLDSFNRFCVGLSFTLPVFVLASAGLLVTLSTCARPERYVILSWLSGLALYFALTSRHMIRHSYYCYPAVPLGVILASATAAFLWNNMSASTIARTSFALLTTSLVLHYYYPIMYPVMYTLSDQARRILILSKLVREKTEKDELVITSAGHGLPEVLYYSDRKGWNIDYRKATPSGLASYRKRGAKYFAFLQPFTSRFSPMLKDKRSMYSLVRYVNKQDYNVNYCIGAGFGFVAITRLKPWFDRFGEKSGVHIGNSIAKIIARVVHTGEGLDSLEKFARIDMFLLPHRFPGEKTFKLEDTLMRHPGWKLIYFDDGGLIFLKASGRMRNRAINESYIYLDPTNYSNFTRLEHPDTELLACCLEEAERARRQAPRSLFCAGVLSTLLLEAGKPIEGMAVFSDPRLVALSARQCKLNQLAIAVTARMKKQALSLASEIRKKWPKDKTAAGILSKLDRQKTEK